MFLYVYVINALYVIHSENQSTRRGHDSKTFPNDYEQIRKGLMRKCSYQMLKIHGRKMKFIWLMLMFQNEIIPEKRTILNYF